MLGTVKNLFYTDTAKDTLIVSLGTIINVVAGGLFFILAPRILGPADYGLFSTVVATGLMAASIANFGIDTGILKFAKFGDSDFNKILSLAIKSYIIFGLVVAALGLLFAPLIAEFLGQKQITNLLRIAFIGNIFILLTNFYVAGMQAKREFTKASIVIISSNILRILILALSAYFLTIGLLSLTLIFFSVTFVSVIIGKFSLPFSLEKTNKKKLIDFHKYNFFIAISLIISTIPFDNYFLLKIAGPVQTGLYAAPLKILTFTYQLGGNFSRVLAPRFALFDTKEKVIAYSRKAAAIVFILISGLILFIIFAESFSNLLFGSEFKNSVAIMQILSLGFIFFTASIIPSAVILFYFGKSGTLFRITVIKYISFAVFLTLLIPDFGAIGAALAFTASETFSFILMATFSYLNLKKS